MEQIATPQGFMFDVDGTLILSNRSLGEYQILPGAAECLHELDARGLPFVALTNGSAYPGAVQAAKLRKVGLPIADDAMLTPNSVAGYVFRERGVGRVLVLGTEGVSTALNELGIATCGPEDDGADQADAVYIAWAPGATIEQIHVAAEAVLRGASFYSASDVPFFATRQGRSFGYSCAISGAIARVTGKEPEVTGKPSVHAIEFISAKLGVPIESLAIVGDDPVAEMQMARDAGAIGVAVTSGSTSAEEWAAQGEGTRPHRVIGGVGELLAAVGL
jgi:4-nitrophenyl phosphatase